MIMRLGRKLIAFGLVLAATAAQADSDAVGGSVIQGNTTFRLWGVYIPGPAQVCEDGWTVGKAAADYQAELMAGQSVVCDPKGDADVPPPRAAVCKVGTKDMAKEMVNKGLGWARLSDGTDYVVPEAEAQAQLLGVHGHMCRIVREQTLERYRER